MQYNDSLIWPSLASSRKTKCCALAPLLQCSVQLPYLNKVAQDANALSLVAWIVYLAYLNSTGEHYNHITNVNVEGLLVEDAIAGCACMSQLY
jgi:hypothetical protein